MRITRRYAALGAASAVGLAWARSRRRSRLARAAQDFAASVMSPPAPEVSTAAQPPAVDEAHAPGHRHRRWARWAPAPAPPASGTRPFAKHRHGLRHPGRG